MRKPKHFNLEEFLTSSTARQKSIENLPSWDIVEHLRELALFLDDLREAWGSGIKITSGFRNDALNSKVGGVENSIHRIGFAADIYPSNGKFEEFKKFVVEWLKDKKFDELIIEGNKKTGAEWLHLQLYSNNGFQRCKTFKMVV
jgi:hypothetical protein